MSMNFEFSKQKNRCCLCGGELTDYEKQFGYPDHAQRAICVEVLQNTLVLLSKNDDIKHNLIIKLIVFIQSHVVDLDSDWLEKIDQNPDITGWETKR